MYIRLPDYDDFQCYDLGVGGVLSQIAHKIYANFHKPSWRTLKHHLFMAENTKNLCKRPKDVSGNDKRAISNRKECLGWLRKMPIANTFNELVEMDFVDYGDFATVLQIRGTFPRLSAIIFTGAKRK